VNRRSFIIASSVAATAINLPAVAQSYMAAKPKIKVILFDGFAIFDPRSVFKLANQLFPDKGNELVKEWKTKQFEYTWLRSMSNNYTDFLTITEDALKYAAKTIALDVSDAQRKQLVDAYYNLQTWPDVPKALGQLNKAGYRLGILSNFTTKMLTTNTSNCHITEYFEQLLSVDKVNKYKPDPITYQLGLDKFNVSKSDVLFIPFAGWDAAGAKKFGYQTFWTNRLAAPLEELGVEPDGTGKDLNDLLAFCDVK